jgi:hypothetical protein
VNLLQYQLLQGSERSCPLSSVSRFNLLFKAIFKYIFAANLRH